MLPKFVMQLPKNVFVETSSAKKGVTLFFVSLCKALWTFIYFLFSPFSLHQFLCDNLFATKQCQRYSLADERLAVVLFGVYILLHYKYMVLELFQWEVLTFIKSFFATLMVVVFLYSDSVT